MAQISYRSSSFNSVFRPVPNLRDNIYKPASQRIGSNSCHNFKGQNSIQAHRPVTPIVHRSSEDHIHRIRSATSRSDFKLQVLAPSICGEKIVPNEKHSSESDNDDVESVDWAAPLDITAFLYKPEYIIRPSSKSSREEIRSTNAEADNQNNDSGVGLKASPCQSASKLPIISQEKGSMNSTKEEFVKSYVRKSMRRDARHQFNREMSDYTEFIKELKDEIREMSQETTRLEIQSFSPRARKQEPREDIVHRGYVTLKRIYELNPELTESAAKKNICGPPGNHWMGLTRVEVLEIMKRIRKELGVSIDDDDNDAYTNKKLQKRRSRKNKKPSKKIIIKDNNTKQTPRARTPRTPRTPIIPSQHVPGPKHLHSNVCIRPWEASLDGWNYASDETRDVTASRTSQIDCDNPPPNSPRRSPKTSSHNSLSDEQLSVSNQDKTGEEDFITLEIFNPVYKVYR